MRAQFGQRFWLSVGLSGLSIAGHPFTLALGLGAIATLATPVVSYAAVLTSWRFNASNSELEITVPDGATPRYFLLAQPARIVVDLPNTTVGTVPALQSYSGSVRQIRVGEFQPGLTRIVIELAPDVVLASPQVELRQLGQGRWGLRPRFEGETAGDSSVAAQPNPSPAPAPSSPQATAPPAIAPAPEPSPVAESSSEPVRDPIQVQPPDMTPPPTVAATPQPAPSSQALAPQASASPLPPLEPDATEIPVEIPEAAIAPDPIAPESSIPESNPPEPTTPEPTPTVVPTPTPVVPQPVPSVAAPSAAPDAISEAAREPYDPQLPTTLPPATLARDRPVTVQVPALGSPSVNRSSPGQPAPAQPAVNAPPEPSRSAAPSAITTVPPVTAPPVSNASIVPTAPNPVAVAPPVAVNPSVLLPSGTVLRLRYPREQVLALEAGSPWQEVLVLNQAVSDRAGNVIAPEGSPVIGRFETDQSGSRFVVQAISLGGRNVRMAAQSNPLEGDRQVTENQLVRNSALGSLALTVLGAFTGVGAIAGLVAGAAAGAATTYITAPQPATIQPNQIVEVRLVEDLPRLQ